MNPKWGREQSLAPPGPSDFPSCNKELVFFYQELFELSTEQLEQLDPAASLFQARSVCFPENALVPRGRIAAEPFLLKIVNVFETEPQRVLSIVSKRDKKGHFSESLFLLESFSFWWVKRT